jgi:hypothetical protein
MQGKAQQSLGNNLPTNKKFQIIQKKTNLELCHNSARNMTDYEAASLTMIFRNRQKNKPNNTKENKPRIMSEFCSKYDRL